MFLKSQKKATVAGIIVHVILRNFMTWFPVAKMAVVFKVKSKSQTIL